MNESQNTLVSDVQALIQNSEMVLGYLSDMERTAGYRCKVRGHEEHPLHQAPESRPAQRPHTGVHIVKLS